MLKTLRAAALTVALLSIATPDTAATSSKREFRSTWFTTHVNIDWPRTKGNSTSIIEAQKADLLNYLGYFERLNLNGICFQVRAQCDAVYKSSYEPWSAVMTGTRGLDPGWDPLAYAIEECHKRGLECYAWINPFRWSNGPDYNTPQDKKVKENGWVLSWDGYYVLNPALPEARAHILKVCEEIVDKYDIDGVLFDDYFYPNNIPENNQAGDWEDYKKSGTSLSIGDWRRENINLFVREFKAMVEKNHPDMRFGISPAGVAGKSASKFGVDPVPVAAGDWQYGTIYSDPLAWLYENSIDFISPQIYWTTTHSTAPYEPLCKWWTQVAEKFGRHFYSSQSVSFLNGANTASNWKEVATQVELNRKYAAQTESKTTGTIYFSSKYFYGPTVSGLGDYLANGVYAQKALVPIVPWKEKTSFDAPKDLKLNGKVLSWTPVDAGRSIVRYTVYAIPKDISYDEAADSEGDGLDIKYFSKVVYGSSYTLPDNLSGNFWYAVCVYDGSGYEHTPAIVNYPADTSEQVKLVSPANGEKLGWDAKFVWSSIADGSYTLRIASDADFRNIAGTYSTNTSSIELSLDDFNPTSTFYWQVRASQPGKLMSTSDTRSFITPTLTPAPATTLLTPDNGTTVGDDIKFSWTATQGIDSYTLEIAKDDKFSDMAYTTTLGSDVTTFTLRASMIGRGKFVWRVVTDGPRLSPTPSESRSFVVDKISIGLTEPGYTISCDPVAYEEKEGVKIENLWWRTVDLGNLTLADNGMMERSMVALGDYVYLTRRSENSEGANLMLEKYDGYTGEHVNTIKLGTDACVPLYPLNTVTRDDAGNIVIANLTTNAMTNPVVVHKVDLTTGEVTRIATITLSGHNAARVDHIAVTGDVSKGNFAVWFLLASNTYAYRVTYVDGEQASMERTAVNNFYPSTCNHFGIAAALTPVNNDEFLANGGNIGMARYSFSRGDITDSFDNSELPGGATNANGSGRFELGNHVYTAYPVDDHTGSNGGFRFDLVRSPDESFAGMKHIATVPRSGLGQIASSTSSTPISAVIDADGSARVYFYAVGNGLAAYRVIDTKNSINSVDNDATLSVSADGLSIILNHKADNVAVYTPSGVQVAIGTDCDHITVPTAGMYIVIADGKTARIALH